MSSSFKSVLIYSLKNINIVFFTIMLTTSYEYDSKPFILMHSVFLSNILFLYFLDIKNY